MPTPNIRPNNSNEGKLGTEAHFWAEVNAATIKEAGVRVATLASPDLTGTPTAPKPADADNTTKIATTSWVRTLITGIWLKLTGSPTTNNLLKYDGSGIMSDSGQSTTTLLARANHTGVQAQSTITDLVADQATQTTAITTNATAIATNTSGVAANLASINALNSQPIYDSAIVNLTGGSATTDLDGIATLSVTLGRLQVVVLTNGSTYFYKLIGSNEIEDSPTYIRPDDYVTTSNEKVWALTSVTVDSSKTNTIDEATSGSGVTVDGVICKDNNLTAAAVTGATVTSTGDLNVAEKVIFSGVQTVAAGSGTTILDLTKSVHHISSDLGGDTFTLTDGTEGQIKTICKVDSTGIATINPTSLAGGGSITLSDAGQSVMLQFVGTDWYVLGESPGVASSGAGTDAAQIATNVTDIATNVTDIETNATDIATLVAGVSESRYDPPITTLATGVYGLRGIATNTMAVGKVRMVVLADLTTNFYKLITSTADHDEPTYIRPTDYADIYNTKVWVLTSSSSGGDLETDTIAEATAGSGVTIDGVLIKDNDVTATGTVTGAALAGDIAGKVVFSGIETVAGGTAGGTTIALDLTKTAHLLQTDSSNDPFYTLADGTEGQIKTICKVDSTGIAGIQCASPSSATFALEISLDDAGDTVILQFIGGKWHIIGGMGYMRFPSSGAGLNSVNGEVSLDSSVEFSEQAEPTAVADKAILYAVSGSGGKTELKVMFPTGVGIQVAIEA